MLTGNTHHPSSWEQWALDTKETSEYGNPTHRPRVMFTFGVNSVCACTQVCADTDPLGMSLRPESAGLRVSMGDFPTWGHIKKKKSRDATLCYKRNSEKYLWNSHKGIPWTLVGLREMGFDTARSRLDRVGGYMATVARLWLVKHLRFYDLLPFGLWDGAQCRPQD